MMFANLVLILLASCQVEAFFQAFRPVVSVRRKLFMTNSEAASTALLKVPAAAWRWPNSWPFAEDVFNPSTTVNPRDLSVEEERGKHFREKIWNYFQSEHKLQGNILLIDENIEDHHNLENVSLQKEVKLHSKYDYSDELFDAIIVLTGFDASSKPRDDFRELWRVLKPGGTCNVVFYGGTNQTSDQQPVKLWSTTNDEQKIWISGAFMQYAVQGGWNQIEAYDVSGVTGNETMSFQKTSDADLPIFLIRGTKFDLAPVSSASTADEIAAYIEKKIIILSNMDELEKKLMSMRLASQLIHENTQIETVSWTPILQKLESIFTVLKGNQITSLLLLSPLINFPHTIEVKDNVIPRPAKTLLGFLLLKEVSGSFPQCSHCSKQVCVSYPLVELSANSN